MRRSNLSLLLLILLGAAMFWPANTRIAGQEIKNRVWTSRDGLERVRASLVQFDRERGTVRLRDRQGRVRDLALQQLSLNDQRFLQRQRKSDEKTEETKDIETSVKEVQDSETPGETQRLYGIDWQPSLESGLKVASSVESPSEERPVMWFRVLGDLDGLM